MDNRYYRHNRRKYSLKVHIVLVTKYRKQLLQGSIADDVKQKILDIANTRGYEIIAMETDKDHIHFLLSYDATDRVCDIVKIVKQETTYYLWQKYNSVLSKQYWKKKIFWSDGYFACSIGEVSSATIQKYIEITDLCSVFFNLMDNAIEACLQSGSQKPFIRLSTEFSGECLSIYLHNTKNPEQIFNHQTTKKESYNPLPSHGFGLSIIEDICRKYDGAYQWLDRTDYFDSIVLLKLL